MSQYQICFIDDSIPTIQFDSIDDAERLNRSNIKLLLKELPEWPEIDVRNLAEILIEDSETWLLSGFTHPNSFLASITRENYRPDIIIYDWEYAAGPTDTFSMLLDILRGTFASVYIYSGTDHEHEIMKAMAHSDFEPFWGKRLEVLLKDGANHEVLVEGAKRLLEENFSFRFGAELRRVNSSALENILVELGKHDIRFVSSFLGDGEGQKTDFKEFIAERVKNYFDESDDLRNLLVEEGRLSPGQAQNLLKHIRDNIHNEISGMTFDLPPADAAGEATESIKHLWQLRLYHQPSDDLVRRGDIIRFQSSNLHYIIVTANCDMLKFWNKNFGQVNALPLYCIQGDREALRNKFMIARTETQARNDLSNAKHTSILHKLGNMPEGPFAIPFVGSSGEIKTFICFPKEATSFFVEPPEAEVHVIKGSHLSYPCWPDAERLATLSEPFGSGITAHSLDTIFGYGVPDYPDQMSGCIHEEISKIFPSPPAPAGQDEP